MKKTYCNKCDMYRIQSSIVIIVLLAKAKLNTMKVWISKALIESSISHD